MDVSDGVVAVDPGLEALVEGAMFARPFGGEEPVDHDQTR